ncbi:uncharacterized protein LOC114516802 [Dendronephthya gigantea]|uniref:uncharacterized protein LOC114516802 n=1 Tax=Dendronephthya gigantea TaxID=151771 RepID=UPI00106DA2A4|nr:uncharacterized protein LOC114516802 [Dendronephthya gigantea]
MAASRQHLCGLAFTSICCILFGGAIAACGLLFQFHDDYNDENTNGMKDYYYYYTQYWLGAPLIVLGVVILLFLCSKVKQLLYVCVFMSSLTLTLAITAVVLEGPKWGVWLQLQQRVDDHETEDVNGVCTLKDSTFPVAVPVRSPLSCQEILFATLMQSIVVGCSILSIVVSQFVVFISIRAISRMAQESYKFSKNQHGGPGQYENNSSMNIMSSQM